MQFDIFYPCSSSLVCAAHFKPWSSAARAGEVGEQVGAPLVCEGLGRAGCGMDALVTGQRNASGALCHCSPGCLTYSYLHACPAQTGASPSSFQECSALQGQDTAGGLCLSSSHNFPSAVLVPGCLHGLAFSAIKHKPKAKWVKITIYPRSCFLSDLP